MKKSVRFLAGLSAVMMALGSASAVSAAEIKSDVAGSNSGGLTGNGAVEGTVKTDVIKVVLPTTNLNFKLDPQGLIAKSEGAKWPMTDGKTISLKKGTTAVTATDKGLIYFTTKSTKTADGKKFEELEYNNTVELVVENKSSIDIYVKPAIKVTAPTGVTLVKSAALSTAGADTAALAMSLSFKKDATTNAKIEAETSGTAVEGTALKMAGIPNAYVYGYDKAANSGAGAYTYKLDENKLKTATNAAGTVTAPTLSFTLTGACNDSAAWTKVLAAQPKVNVTWTISRTATTTTTTK